MIPQTSLNQNNINEIYFESLEHDLVPDTLTFNFKTLLQEIWLSIYVSVTKATARAVRGS